MITQTGTKRINDQEWEISELAKVLEMEENNIHKTPPEVLKNMLDMKGQLHKVQSEKERLEQAQKSKGNARIKQSQLEKFQKKATGTLADSFRRYLREEWTVQRVEKTKEERDRTDQNMDSYGEKVLAVLFEMGLLQAKFEQLIRDTLNSKD